MPKPAANLDLARNIATILLQDADLCTCGFQTLMVANRLQPLVRMIGWYHDELPEHIALEVAASTGYVFVEANREELLKDTHAVGAAAALDKEFAGDHGVGPNC